jgi:ribosomal protein S19E (S16A)
MYVEIRGALLPQTAKIARWNAQYGLKKVAGSKPHHNRRRSGDCRLVLKALRLIELSMEI